MYVIYRHVNILNGKSYIGYTKYSIQLRWKQHLRCAERGSHLPFHSAIRKHGPHVWFHQVLERREKYDTAIRSEVELISRYQTFGSMGYNATPGGDGVLSMTPEQKLKHSKAVKLAMQDPKVRSLWLTNLKAAMNTPESRLKRSRLHKLIHKQPHVIAKMKATFVRSRAARSEMMRKKHTDHEFKARHLRASTEFNQRTKSKQVSQFDLSGNLVASFASCAQASHVVGISRAGVSNCARGLTKTAGGFVWRYVEKTGS